MATLQVQVNPANPGSVTVRVWTYTSPGPNFNWVGVATSQKPVNQSWDNLQPGAYAVTLSWNEGYQNIAGGGGSGNSVIYDGNFLYYQVLGNPGDANGISATFPFQLS